MNKYLGRGNKEYILGSEIAHGGEGIIYSVANENNCAAKIFHKSCRTTTRERKLKAMIATNASSSVTTQSTWPIDILYEEGSFAGYIMLKLTDNTNINAIYSTSSNATLPEKIIIAKNLCSAIQAIHDSGHVCGDLNPKNICVNSNSGRITLVDADSYHITDPSTGHIFRCEVGLPEYFAPELQVSVSKSGRDLRTAPLPTFSIQTDLFALAVHIFALLMNGCHPYACAKNNVINMPQLGTNKPSLPTLQPNENIVNEFFPFEDRRTGYSVPLYAPDYDYLPDEIKALFHKAFKTLSRPTAEEWHNALSKFKDSLIHCSKNTNHYYPSSNGSCPWCAININRTVQNITKQQAASTSTSNNTYSPTNNTAQVYIPHNYTLQRNIQVSRNLVPEICGILSFFCVGWVAAIIGLFFYYKYKKDPNKYVSPFGKWLCIISLALYAISVIITIIVAYGWN